MPHSIEGDVVTSTQLIVDGTESPAGEVVLQIKYAIRHLAVIEDMEKWSFGNGITAHLTGTHIVCDVGVIRPPLDVDLAAALSATRQNEPVTPSADMAVGPGPEPLLRSDGGSGWHGSQATSRNPTRPSADHGAGPTALCGAGSDEVALIIVRFGRVEVFGMACVGVAAFLTTVESHQDRRCAIEDTQAINIEKPQGACTQWPEDPEGVERCYSELSQRKPRERTGASRIWTSQASGRTSGATLEVRKLVESVRTRFRKGSARHSLSCLVNYESYQRQ